MVHLQRLHIVGSMFILRF